MEFVSAKHHQEQLRAWVNTYLAESWEEDSEQLDGNEILERREKYADPCPQGVLVLTSAIDVQKDRVEVLVGGHGHHDELWWIDHRIFYGAPSSDAVWNDLADFLVEPWHHPSGKDLRIMASFCDSGFETQNVYKFCRRMAGQRVFPSKGVGGSGRPAVGRPSKANSARIGVFPVGVNTLKEIVFSRLKNNQPGPAYWHIPEHFDDEWCYQLTSEKAVKRYSKGIPRIDYVKIRPRNEALDLVVLNLAALAILNVNTERVQQRLDEVRKPEPEKPKFPQRMMKPKPSWTRRYK